MFFPLVSNIDRFAHDVKDYLDFSRNHSRRTEYCEKSPGTVFSGLMGAFHYSHSSLFGEIENLNAYNILETFALHIQGIDLERKCSHHFTPSLS